LASTFFSKRAICGCRYGFSSGGITQNTVIDTPCCYAVDLGEIYNLEPDYVSAGLCQQCTYHDDFTLDPETGESDCGEPTPSQPPHRCRSLGAPYIPWIQRGARLVIFKGATIDGSTINYLERKIYYSRHRIKFPNLSFSSFGCFIGNPIHCDAENGVFQCAGSRIFGGPYKNTQLIPYYNNQGNISGYNLQIDYEAFIPQTYKFSMSPCEIEWEVCDGNGENCFDNAGYLMGYADAPEDWWFLSDPEYTSWESEVAGIDPFGSQPHTIYAHFEMDGQPLDCCTTSGHPGCGGGEDINLTGSNSPCGSQMGRRHWLSDDAQRKKSVRITAAVGFTLEKCGYTPQQACDELYADNESPFSST
jgi:hypothetical protein